MGNWLDSLLHWSQTAADFMWGEWMIALLIGTGVLLTFVTRGIQFRKLGLALRFVLRGAAGKEEARRGQGDISPFAALMTALAATVGNGNIAGVATAIATGGPGAPFWMWVSALFGMATKYAEGFLGVKYRKVAEDGTMAGGPMYYCRYGIRYQPLAKFMGMLFAVCGAFTALFGTGNMMQSNSMALAFKSQFGVPTLISALVITFLVGLVIIGGIKRIGAVAERLVPTMILLYLGGAAVIILARFTAIDDAFALIIRSAFSVQAVGGALIGTGVKQAISLGVRRGVLSNEAGLGSAAIAQAAASSPDPTYNGLIAMTGVFIDTIVVNTLTTLAIVLTGVWMLTPAAGVPLLKEGTVLAADQLAHLPAHARELASAIGVDLSYGGLSSTALTATAFNSVIPRFGGWIVALCSFLFGYTTLIGWAYYGEQCVEYFLGVRSTMAYRLVYIALLFFGALVTGKYLNIVWYIGDTANAIMAFPNLVALLLLSGVVAKVTRWHFLEGLGEGGERV
ncbi:MAG: sodium:alanine symporter family protein [candidate division KSB1 bacterium]|nr:sodium:alanine symporter family protein [candidate division KSB1 bacterium]